jgi:hypothetical protein
MGRMVSMGSSARPASAPGSTRTDLITAILAASGKSGASTRRAVTRFELDEIQRNRIMVQELG